MKIEISNEPSRVVTGTLFVLHALEVNVFRVTWLNFAYFCEKFKCLKSQPFIFLYSGSFFS